MERELEEHLLEMTYSSESTEAETSCWPLYWPQLMHTRCGTLGSEQFGHCCVVGWNAASRLHEERRWWMRVRPRRRFWSGM